MQKKEEVDLSHKKKKKSFLWLRARYLYGKFILSDRAAGRSIAAS